jgi:carbon-monoxide dehydrogenase large subunit
LAAGQIHGGVAQGLGQALMENCVYDPDSGQLMTASFQDYAMPRADDMPPMHVQFNENAPCTTNMVGSKGAGEAGTIGALPALVSAVCDALGIAHIDMPMTSESVWRAAQKK